MGLLNAFKQYVRDALPGGALNPEVTPQGLLDTAALGTAPVPIVGDVLGLLADGKRLRDNPEERTLGNYGLSALGLLPFMPSLGMIRPATDAVWFRGQSGAKAADEPFAATLRGTPSFADSADVASKYAVNPNAAGNYGWRGADDVSGASVHPYKAKGQVLDINEYQGGHGTQTGITPQQIKKLAAELGVNAKTLTDDLLEHTTQKWGRGINSYWDAVEPSVKSKNRLIPAYAVAENPMVVDAAKAKGVNAIQFKGAMSNPSAATTSIPWDETLVHQELRPLTPDAIRSVFEDQLIVRGGLLNVGR
jgi:hypothetical protein